MLERCFRVYVMRLQLRVRPLTVWYLPVWPVTVFHLLVWPVAVWHRLMWSVAIWHILVWMKLEQRNFRIWMEMNQ